MNAQTHDTEIFVTNFSYLDAWQILTWYWSWLWHIWRDIFPCEMKSSFAVLVIMH